MNYVAEIAPVARGAGEDEDAAYLDSLPEPQLGLSEADGKGCRWIEGEPRPLRAGMFCCEPCPPGEPFCPAHRARVWRRPARRLGAGPAR
jgi:hypothetical protein